MPDEIKPGQDNQIDLSAENAFTAMFSGAQSASGDQELLRVATDFAPQYTGEQMRTLCYIYGLIARRPDSFFAKMVEPILDKYVLFKRNHDSALYVQAALDSIALRKFVNENTMKVNIQK